MVFGTEARCRHSLAAKASAARSYGLLGCKVDLEVGYDVFTVYPTRPETAHQHLRALKVVREAR